MSLLNPTTLDEYFDTLNVDEELRPKYRKWLENIFRKMPKKTQPYWSGLGLEMYVKGWKEGQKDMISDMSDRIKNM